MDWLRSEDLKEEKNVTAPMPIIAVEAAYQWAMSGIRPEYLDPEPLIAR